VAAEVAGSRLVHATGLVDLGGSLRFCLPS
jgi:hypothetical protein